MNWFILYTQKTKNDIFSFAEVAHEREPVLRELLPLSPKTTPEMMEWIQHPSGDMYESLSANQLRQLSEAIDAGLIEWEKKQGTQQEEAWKQKRMKETIPLTPEQQRFITENEHFIRGYILDKLKEKFYEGKTGSQFVPDPDTLEDISQEGLIKVMEIIPKKWDKLTTNRWKYLHKAMDHIIDRLTTTSYPSVVKQHLLQRQYFPGGIRETQYNNPPVPFMDFMDALMIQYGGKEIFKKNDSQTLEEAIDYIAQKYRDEIIERGLSNSTDFSGNVSQYKKVRLRPLGGKHQVDLMDLEDLQDDKLLSVINLQNLPDDTPEEQSQRDILSKFIHRTIDAIPNMGIKLATVLFYGLDMKYFGFNFSQEQLRSILQEANKGWSDPDLETTPNWSGIQRVLPQYIVLLGGNKKDVKEAEKIANMSEEAFHQQIKEYIQSAYRDYYSNPENLPV
jgi:hypothetical protein